VLRRLLALVVLIALALGGLYYWRLRHGGGLPPGKPVQAIQDAKTTLSVKTALGLSRSLRPYSIAVETEDGIVTLRGELPSPELRALAERTAAAVPQVRQVVAHLKVAPEAGKPAPDGGERTLGESLDDHALAVQVRLALSLNKGLEGSDIDVKAFRREVTLSGDVARPEQKRLAVDVAAETASVAGVVDQLHVRGARASSGPRDVERALGANASLAGYKLSAREAEGRLVISGRVRSNAEKELAGMVAQQAAGTSVENDIEVAAKTVRR
jgi:hyperosmotically inducible protein